MKNANLVLLFLLALAWPGVSQTTTSHVALAPIDGWTSAQVDSIAEKVASFPGNTQLAIALLRDSSVSFYGVWRDQDTLRTVSNAGAVFEIGSISKVFTATLLAAAVEKGQVSLDQPVREHLSFIPPESPAFTFRQLANHSSGLPRLPQSMAMAALMHPENPYRDFDEPKLEQYLSSVIKTRRQPGEQYEYSNLGAGILAFALSRIEKQSYEELLQATIFRPLGMQHSGTRRETLEDRLVRGQNPAGQVVPNWDFIALAGAGAVLSSVEDMARFGQANFDTLNPVFHRQQEETFSVNSNFKVALGWHIILTRAGERWLWHNGATGGYSSSMALDVVQKRGIVILSNVSAFHPQMKNIDALCFALLKTLRP
ncbi:MAG: beta-lactamase family protein [Saprospiraceae bacterium]|nr:beta-lactamase family protein [Saprospiraceae bacterium]